MAELVSKVYAEALFDVGLEKGSLEALSAQLSDVCQIFAANPEFFELYKAPNIALDNRKKIVEDTFGGQVLPELLNFLRLLLDKNRGFFIQEIGRDFQKLVETHQGVVKGIVYVTYALSDDQIRKLEDKLSTSTGKRILLTQKIDPEILGGLVVHLGDKVIDNSFKKKLDDMKEDLLQLIV